VYCAFLDADKAFDKVLHNGIYKKLLERGAPVNFIFLLQNCYGRVRQGGILSPYLFAIYICDLITHLKNSGYGIYVGQIFFTDCALYTDDIALLSASCYIRVTESSKYLQIVWDALDVKFNSLKSQLIMAALHSRCGHYILVLFLLFFLLFSFFLA